MNLNYSSYHSNVSATVYCVSVQSKRKHHNCTAALRTSTHGRYTLGRGICTSNSMLADKRKSSGGDKEGGKKGGQWWCPKCGDPCTYVDTFVCM